MTATKSDFAAAEEIKGVLEGRDRAEQERIVRWVCESLDLSVAKSSHRSHPHELANPSPAASIELREHATTGQDIRSWINSKQSMSDNQFVAAVAYFYRFVAPVESRKESITSDELQEACRQAGRPVFKVPSKPINNAIGQGYVDRAGTGMYRLNAVGENLISMTLSPSADGATKRASKKKTKKRETGKSKRKHAS